MSENGLPKWAEEMRATFRAGTISQFVVHGNVYDLVVHRNAKGQVEQYSLPEFVASVMLQPFDAVLYYSQGTGIQVKRGKEEFHKFLKVIDQWNQTSFAASPSALPRDAGVALDLLNRFLHYGIYRTDINDAQKFVSKPLRIGIILDYASFIFPAGGGSSLSQEAAESLIKVLRWANDPAITGSFVMTCLITENLNDLNPTLAHTPYNDKVRIDLPTADEIEQFIPVLFDGGKSLADLTDLDLRTLSEKLVGLSRVNIKKMVSRCFADGEKLDNKILSELKKDLIEKECNGLLSFIESAYTLDLVAGLDQAKEWLREDARLLKMNKLDCIPMGYLMCGRIGTGKTFLTMCWAGEIGIPCVVLKNFRDKWVGSTEGNLEKIFNILHALNGVMVFVDEADQATGKRGQSDDSGVSGRIYSMLAKEMSDTRNRGKIIWVFATSRPDLLEVDLKRAGRLDVRIPLFPPQTPEERQELFRVVLKKLKFGISEKDIPPIPENLEIGGNELEAVLVRARRRFELQADDAVRVPLRDIIAEVLAEFRPSADVLKLEYMDLVAVKECTDHRFLSRDYRDMPLEQVLSRIAALRPHMM